jgi:small subunit ribosomal protein S17
MATSETKKTLRGKRDARVGVVDSVSGKQTIRVVFENLQRDPMYGKILRRRTRLLAHDERQEAKLGDTVELVECRPISKRKSWRLTKVLKRTAVE